jgi:uncharacterized membrane protein YdjX (TVP38/TMEM64 family)
MSLVVKIFTGALFLALLFAGGFALWGEHFELLFSQQACAAWFAQMKPYAWLIGIGLLIGDLVLPIPATGIMAALGSVYGLWTGAMISILGSTMAGFTGYGLARFAGRRISRYLASEEELDRFTLLFNQWGGAAIIISRIMPILPEVMVILAGVSRMKLINFSIALLLGTVPTCFLFTSMGQAAQQEPVWGVGTAVFVPLLIWPVFLRFFVPAREKNPTMADKR